jgi:perosamine synthetase
MTIPIIKSEIGNEEIAAVSEVLLSGWVTQGPKVAEFERAFAEYVGAKHACAVSSCTAALHLGLLMVGVRPGDVVITVSHSFIATSNSVRYCQAEPFFVDIDPKTLNMDPNALIKVFEEAFEKRDQEWWLKNPERLSIGESPLVYIKPPVGRLAAILVVHQVGMPANMQAIVEIAGAHKIPVVEDAACAIGSEILKNGKWEKIGSGHSEVTCFSFHPRKILTTGDGGMITTNRVDYDQKFRLLRQHGMSMSDAKRHQSKDIIFENYALTAYNYRMTDIQAAIGIEQLKKLPAIVQRRRELAEIYRECLDGILGLILPTEPNYARSNWQSFIVRLSDPSKQKRVMKFLQERGIASRRGIMNVHQELPYQGAFPNESLPESTRARDAGIILPLFHSMECAEVKLVTQSLIDALSANEK